ncbi:alpha/beta fold hydrolase [Methyloversatilis thermotolerans]|uniref:alpha/beta fold hydrolase n=1 Tax=Methyloversatilis thermotolerans TaxID=1346290 RepID=UPI00035F9B57|nr:alpha/beta hydrolase [Methyloversatilis thermotolerans]
MGVLNGLRRWFSGGREVGPRLASVQCTHPDGLHRMAYAEWGDARNPRVLVCVHGLTRVGRDFDALAGHLARHYRVICPDVVGRGRSDWLPDASGYAVPQYVADMVTLIARLDVEQVHWVGTSMGGLIGMALAALPDTPIGRLVLNDVGPVITAASLRRIADYVGKAPHFASIEDAERYVRMVSAPFGPLDDAQWRHLTVHCTRPLAGGGFEMGYDPAIARPMQGMLFVGDIELWPLYDAIRCPTLCVRGAESDLLTRDTLQQMAQRGPRARTLEVPGVGHAPMFMDRAQIEPVASFLMEDRMQ